MTGKILTSKNQRLPQPSQVWIFWLSVNEIMAPPPPPISGAPVQHPTQQTSPTVIFWGFSTRAINKLCFGVRYFRERLAGSTIPSEAARCWMKTPLYTNPSSLNARIIFIKSTLNTWIIFVKASLFAHALNTCSFQTSHKKKTTSIRWIPPLHLTPSSTGSRPGWQGIRSGV